MDLKMFDDTLVVEQGYIMYAWIENTQCTVLHQLGGINMKAPNSFKAQIQSDSVLVLWNTFIELVCGAVYSFTLCFVEQYTTPPI
jgi:hypothetical protein